jgi:hypothetical protein
LDVVKKISHKMWESSFKDRGLRRVSEEQPKKNACKNSILKHGLKVISSNPGVFEDPDEK